LAQEVMHFKPDDQPNEDDASGSDKESEKGLDENEKRYLAERERMRQRQTLVAAKKSQESERVEPQSDPIPYIGSQNRVENSNHFDDSDSEEGYDDDYYDSDDSSSLIENVPGKNPYSGNLSNSSVKIPFIHKCQTFIKEYIIPEKK